MTDTISKTEDVQDATDTADTPQIDHPEATAPSWAATPVAAATAGRECVDVDPTSLIIGDNVRAGAHLDRQFLASLREFGVMDPIHVIRDHDGTLTVKRGQRRTSARSRSDCPPSRCWSSATTTARPTGSPSSGTRTNAATPSPTPTGSPPSSS